MNDQEQLYFIDNEVNLGENVEIGAYCSILSFDKECDKHLQKTFSKCKGAGRCANN